MGLGLEGTDLTNCANHARPTNPYRKTKQLSTVADLDLLRVYNHIGELTRFFLRVTNHSIWWIKRTISAVKYFEIRKKKGQFYAHAKIVHLIFVPSMCQLGFVIFCRKFLICNFFIQYAANLFSFIYSLFFFFFF